MKSDVHTTAIEADPTVPLIRICRTFDAPPESVFRAHSDPDLVTQWLGPRDLEMRVDHWDCSNGGSYRYVHTRTTDDDTEEFCFRGCFHEVRPSELIVQTFTYEGFSDGVALERLTLERIGEGGTRLAGTSLVDSFEARDGMLASGMETGVREGYEQLDELLAG